MFGKYSVLAYKHWPDDYEYGFNAYGKEPEDWNPEVQNRSEYNSIAMFPNYDEEGYDSYGYSAFDKNGDFVGHGEGVDRAGYTESDYMARNRDSSLYPEWVSSIEKYLN